MVRKMKEITTSEHRVRGARGEGIRIMWQAPRDSCAVGTCHRASAALHPTAASLMVRRDVTWERAVNGDIFWLGMMFVTHLISVPRRRVGHGGMDSQVLRGSFSCRRI